MQCEDTVTHAHSLFSGFKTKRDKTETLKMRTN